MHTDVSEDDPVWLKAKADDFFRSGDIRSALNAYSSAIDIDENMIVCYANRSACYLKLNLIDACKMDCDIAIKKLEETPIESLSSTLIKLYLRRGVAHCQLGKFQESLSDYCQARVKFEQLPGAALKAMSSVDIDLTSINADINRLQVLCNTEIAKREADILFSEKNLEAALAKYAMILQIFPYHVSALSNRSACRLALGDIAGCIDDCSAAITFLDYNPAQDKDLSSKGSYHSMLSSLLPPKNSEKRTQWLLKTLLRRAVAHTQLDQLQEAIADYERAASIEPTNANILADLNSLKSLCKQ